MELRDDLIRMEKKLWSGGQAEYRNTLDSDCLVAFTAMAGISSRDEIASQADARRFHDVDIDVDAMLRPTDDVAILTYHVHAMREKNVPYEAVVSSGYVRRAGAWIAVGGDVAYAFGMQHMTGTRNGGEPVDLWFRATACFRREGSRWRITHMHNSVPFAMDGTDKALLDLRP